MRRSAKAAQSAHTDSCARFCFLAAFRAGGRIGWFCQSQIPTNRSPIDPQFPGNASLGPWEKQFLAAEADGLAVTYENLIDSYLSETHRDHPGNGCPISALACDIARGSQQIRSTFAFGKPPFSAPAACPVYLELTLRRVCRYTLFDLVFIEP
jgi:hypothetical protein